MSLTYVQPAAAPAYGAIAEATLRSHIEGLKSFKPPQGMSVPFAADPAILDASFVNVGSVPLAIASAFIHTWVSTNSPIQFPDGNRVNFKGEGWGVGLGGGIVWVGGTLPPVPMILGRVDFAFTTTPAVSTLTFFRNGNPFGVLAGGGLNVQAGGFGGSGEFTLA